MDRQAASGDIKWHGKTSSLLDSHAVEWINSGDENCELSSSVSAKMKSGLAQVEEQEPRLTNGDRVERLDVSVRWDPPLAVLYDLSLEERIALDSDLLRIVSAAVEDYLKQNLSDPKTVRHRVLRDAFGPQAQAIEFVRVVLEDLPVDLARDLISGISMFALGRIWDSAIGKIRNVTRRAGQIEVVPKLAIEEPAEVNPIYWQGEDDFVGFGEDLAPTDEQLSDSPLIYIRTEFDVHMLGEDIWSKFADYGSTPTPRLFKSLVYASFADLTEPVLPEEYVQVVIEDRPPRADPLFPSYFVDLTGVLGYLRTTVPDELVGALMAAGIEATRRKIRDWLSSEDLPEGAFYNTYSPKTLETLCLNYVKTKRHPRARLVVKREMFNTKFESGYHYPIDPQQPMGWTIQVISASTRFIFVIDSNATIISLEFHEAGNISTIHDADLRAPEQDSVIIPRHHRGR